MRLLTCTGKKATADEFIAFWRKGYADCPEEADEDYAQNIDHFRRLLRCKDYVQARQHLDGLFHWKDPRNLSRRTVDTYWQAICGGGLDKILTDPENAIQYVPQSGCIWRIFLLHCILPQYPIYDQHVHRAMACILGWPENWEIGKLGNERAFELYLSEYRPFHEHLAAQTSASPRDVDRALWAYGKLLRSSRWLFPDHW